MARRIVWVHWQRDPMKLGTTKAHRRHRALAGTTACGIEIPPESLVGVVTDEHRPSRWRRCRRCVATPGEER